MIKKIFLIIGASVVLSGCIPSAFIGGSKSNTVAGGPGTFVKGKAVKGFPALPLYPKAKLLESYGANSSYGASAISDDGLSKVLDFYNQSLPALGWEPKLAKRKLPSVRIRLRPFITIPTMVKLGYHLDNPR